MILLDTNVISELMKERPDTAVLAWIDEQIETDLYYSAITQAEIDWGIAILKDGRRKQLLQQSATSGFGLFAGRCIAYDCNAAAQYSGIALCSKHAGRPMSVEDMMIGAIATANHCLLATRSIKDFDFLPDIRLFNPWDYRQ